MKRLNINIYALIIMVTTLFSCSQAIENPIKVNSVPSIYPDYIGVTIPLDIAPLNFNCSDKNIDCMDVTVRGKDDSEIHSQGNWADFGIDEWHQLIQKNKGASINVKVCIKKNGKWYEYKKFPIYISKYELTDYGLTYRRIPPGYEVGGNIGIYQRDIHSFDEAVILQESAMPGKCFNCHTANRTDPKLFTFQLRGKGGGTLIQRNGKQEWLETKTDSTKAAGSYAYWHPDGRYCAYAVNAVHQSFFVGKDRRIEVYHNFGDVMVLDTRTNELILSPLLQTEDVEIFPAFSFDGKTLFYSTSKKCNVPGEYMKVKCSLCSIGFDAEKGCFGTKVDTLLNGPATDRSYTLARPSYDGRWLMYCISSRSNFPICQKDADLWIMNLKTGYSKALKEVNSNDVESFHNWSSNSHWFVFSSKRNDGMYTQLYISSIDEHGNATKPFLLPQRNPREYYENMFDAYNCPDFTSKKVEFDVSTAHNIAFSNKRIQVKIRKSNNNQK